MRVPLQLLIPMLIISILVDWYIYRQASRRCRRPALWGKAELWSAAISLCILLAGVFIPAKEGGNDQLMTKMWLIFSFLSVCIPKIIAVIFDLLASIPKLAGRRRIRPLTLTGIILACVSFAAIWWGALFNRFRIADEKVEIKIESLPEAFDGYRIVQISDMHVGTYGNDTTFVSRLVDHINALDPDLIVFTGDIVNRETDEIAPFVDVIERLHAPDGVIAILGNHDYGDYKVWDSPADKKANMQRLYDAFSRAGIKLLLNETEWIRRGGDSIAVIGVENIGDPPFPVYGSLRKAYPEIGDGNTKILLSHNPAHWVDSIAGHDDVAVDLTLAGHTHAMQIEVCGISPAALRYATWGGLYADDSGRHRLYVNIGSGTVGLPMRLGATPEVTEITLKL